jgi:hypothetical protein
MLTLIKRSIPIALSIGMLLFNSCTKTNEVIPEDNEEKTEEVIPPGKKEKTNEEIAFEDSMLGLWTFNNISFQKKSTQSLQLNKSMNSPSSNPIKLGVTVIVDNSKMCLMEFLGNRTYLIYDSDKNIFTGKFEAINENTLELIDFGTVTKIETSDYLNKVNIKLKSSGETIAFHGGIFQSRTILIGSKNDQLCVNTWNLSDEEDGKTLLNEASIDKLLVNFSVYGSYQEKRFKNNKLTDFKVKNWLFHYIDENIILFQWALPNEEDITIRELTKNVLKIQERTFINKELKIRNLVFRPEK